MDRCLICLMIAFYLCSCNEPVATKNEGRANAPVPHLVHGNSGYCDSVNNDLIRPDTLKGSPHRTAMNMINGNHVHVEYSSPGVKDRIIWGGLVAYGKVWATGAHNATTVKFDNTVKIHGTVVPKGKYALFTIPGKDKWVVILNTRHEQHLADDYTETEDIVRFEVLPESAAMTQRLTYFVHKKDSAGIIKMNWERISISIPFKNVN